MPIYPAEIEKAIVTGGSRGIGGATKTMLAANGAHLVVADVDVAKADETVRGPTVCALRRAARIMCAMDVLDRALPDLRCRRGDHGALRREATALCCATCGARFLRRGTIVDFVPEIGASTSRAQRAMESPWVAKIYEDHWRPWFTWLGSRIDYTGEERWLRAHEDDWSEGVALDLACGTGRYTRLLSRDHPERMVIGADLSMPMLEQAALRVQAEGLRNVLLVRADAEHLPLRDGSVTRINCFGALHLFPSTERALAELGRVAHSGAGFTCLTAGEHARPLGRRLQRVFSRAASFAFFESRSLARMLGRAGFDGYQEERHGAVLLFAARRRARRVESSTRGVRS